MPPLDLSTWLAGQLEAWSVFSPRHLLAYAAGALAVAFAAAGALVRTMIPLRWLAVGSNLGFLAFGALFPSPATLAVAAVLLPINLYRLHEMVRLTRQVSAAEGGSDLSGLWLRPYMKAKKLRAGTVLFRRGDAADRLYLLAEGRMVLVEIGHEIPAGRVFGEIALFSPAKRRTHSARCLTPCTVLHISEDTVKQLYYQNPAFGFHLIGLVAARLSDDVERAGPPSVGNPSASNPSAGNASAGNASAGAPAGSAPATDAAAGQP
jgi:CRP/FNR family cyclic AMP-dependent transcriptional regulator